MGGLVVVVVGMWMRGTVGCTGSSSTSCSSRVFFKNLSSHRSGHDKAMGVVGERR